MRARFFDPSKDYSEICEWWTKHGWQVIPFNWLPTTGIVVEDEGILLCAGFLYKTDSAMGMLEYVVTNPAAGLKAKSNALDLMINSISLVAKASGVQVIFSAFGSKSLSNRMKEHDFQVIGTEVTNLLRRL